MDEAEARRCGQEAVKYATQSSSGSVAMKRTGNGAKCRVEYFRTDLANVAEKTKSLAGEYMNAEGNGLTPGLYGVCLATDRWPAQKAFLGNSLRMK